MLRNLRHVLPVSRLGLIRIVFEATYDVINDRICKHQLEETDLVEEEKGSDNVEEDVKPFRVLQIFTHVEKFNQFGYVVIVFNGEHQGLLLGCTGQGGGHLFIDLVQLA